MVAWLYINLTGQIVFKNSELKGLLKGPENRHEIGQNLSQFYHQQFDSVETRQSSIGTYRLL